LKCSPITGNPCRLLEIGTCANLGWHAQKFQYVAIVLEHAGPATVLELDRTTRYFQYSHILKKQGTFFFFGQRSLR
jgi:hypothetical protein